MGVLGGKVRMARLFGILGKAEDDGRGRQPNRGRGHLPRNGKKRSREVPECAGMSIRTDPNTNCEFEL